MSSPRRHRPSPFCCSLLFPQATAHPPSTHNGWLLFAPKPKSKLLRWRSRTRPIDLRPQRILTPVPPLPPPCVTSSSPPSPSSSSLSLFFHFLAAYIAEKEYPSLDLPLHPCTTSIAFFPGGLAGPTCGTPTSPPPLTPPTDNGGRQRFGQRHDDNDPAFFGPHDSLDDDAFILPPLKGTPRRCHQRPTPIWTGAPCTATVDIGPSRPPSPPYCSKNAIATMMLSTRTLHLLLLLLLLLLLRILLSPSSSLVLPHADAASDRLVRPHHLPPSEVPSPHHFRVLCPCHLPPPGHHPVRIRSRDDAPPATSSPCTRQHPLGLVRGRGGGWRRTQGDRAGDWWGDDSITLLVSFRGYG